MPRKSTVKRLPPEIREEIHRLLTDGRTLDEILAKLGELGADISRSALGRYSKSFDKVMERVRRSREIAEMLVREYGQEPEGKAMRANIEMMHGIVSDMLMRISDTEKEGDEADPGHGMVLDAQQAMWLGKALDHLSRARKADADVLEKFRAQARKEAAQAVDSVAKKQGLSAQARAAIRAELGVPA